MTLSAEVGEQVRRRANFACEYCGATETGSGGLLTVDHFQPRTRGGSYDLDNLLYCCYRCNLHKADYWPTKPGDAELWNPRKEPREAHLQLLADGTLFPVTPTGEFTLRRLRLNRPQLVARRLHLQAQAAKDRRDAEVRNLLELFAEFHRAQIAALEVQMVMLREQEALLRLLLR